LRISGRCQNGLGQRDVDRVQLVEGFEQLIGGRRVSQLHPDPLAQLASGGSLGEEWLERRVGCFKRSLEIARTRGVEGFGELHVEGSRPGGVSSRVVGSV